MGNIANQVHNKFKIFSSTLNKDNKIGSVATDIANFVKESQVAAKSIGAEYLESVGHLILTIGYRDDEPWYPVDVACISLGKIDTKDMNNFSRIENAMMEASSRLSNVICHELYITKNLELMMIFLIHKE